MNSVNPMIAIVDYNAGNLGSVANALDRLSARHTITNDPEVIKSADGVIFPGQGRTGPALVSLRRSGLDKILPALKQPFLGICLGMELMVEQLEEDNETGLGIIPGTCRHFVDVAPVPHMGWNTLSITQDSQLLKAIPPNSYQYFVHSYAVDAPPQFILATTSYGRDFASAISRDNFYGVQFHPEKSAEVGAQILKNFLALCEAQS